MQATSSKDTAHEPSHDPRLAGLKITHFDFQHRVFQAPGARFVLKGPDKTPTFRVSMGELEGVIDVDILRKEFHLGSDTHDGRLVDTAVAALRYVPDVKPGDTIPTELLTGEASWAVGPRHKRIAEQRLQVQLLSWVSGKELLLTDPKEIANFLQQLENKEKLRKAFHDAAKAIGYDDTEMVIRQLELLARELCYIEALRDRFNMIPLIAEKMAELSKSYGGDRSAKMELNRVQTLLKSGVAEYSELFSEVDAQTGEIISALKSIDRQVSYIRRKRDELHFLIMQWDPHIEDLSKWHARPNPETDKALHSLYRFLAPRFSTGRSLLAARNKEDAARKAEAAEKSAKPAKPQAKRETVSSKN